MLNYVGVSNFKAYDANDCIIVRKVFAFLYNSVLYGSTEFKSISEFVEFINTECVQCVTIDCGVRINGCLFTINGCYATINGV